MPGGTKGLGGRSTTGMTPPAATHQKETDAVTRRSHQRRKKGLGFPRATFARLVKEISQDYKSGLLWQPKGVQAVQEAAEHMLEQRFLKASRLAKLCKVDTITAAHFQDSAPERN